MRIACAWWWIMPRMKSTSALVCGVSSIFAASSSESLREGSPGAPACTTLGYVRAVVRRVVRACAAAEQGRCGESDDYPASPLLGVAFTHPRGVGSHTGLARVHCWGVEE